MLARARRDGAAAGVAAAFGRADAQREPRAWLRHPARSATTCVSGADDLLDGLEASGLEDAGAEDRGGGLHGGAQRVAQVERGAGRGAGRERVGDDRVGHQHDLGAGRADERRDERGRPGGDVAVRGADRDERERDGHQAAAAVPAASAVSAASTSPAVRAVGMRSR